MEPNIYKNSDFFIDPFDFNTNKIGGAVTPGLGSDYILINKNRVFNTNDKSVPHEIIHLLSDHLNRSDMTEAEKELTVDEYME